jgi:hypothetical protein
MEPGDRNPEQASLGPVALFGSGETAPAGRQVHEALFQQLDPPIAVAILETPAGFQPNSAWVADQLAEFVGRHLQNFHPQVTVVPARCRDGPHSTDDRELAAPLLWADYIFAGPGSPTYTVRHLADTWTWHTILARQRRGAVLALASAAAIAAGAHALPVYEIYKVGADLHWADGLDLFGPYGLELAVVTHWDNRDGGTCLDTRCGFMGAERMRRLEALLPPSATLLGIDEHTAVILDLARGTGRVMGRGSVTIRQTSQELAFASGQSFPLDVLGPVRQPALDEGLPPEVVAAVLAAEEAAEHTLSPQVAALIEEREAARSAGDWVQADALREQVARLGYAIEDTPHGPRWRRG